MLGQVGHSQWFNSSWDSCHNMPKLNPWGAFLGLCSVKSTLKSPKVPGLHQKFCLCYLKYNLPYSPFWSMVMIAESMEPWLFGSGMPLSIWLPCQMTMRRTVGRWVLKKTATWVVQRMSNTLWLLARRGSERLKWRCPKVLKHGETVPKLGWNLDYSRLFLSFPVCSTIFVSYVSVIYYSGTVFLTQPIDCQTQVGLEMQMAVKDKSHPWKTLLKHVKTLLVQRHLWIVDFQDNYMLYHVVITPLH